MRGLKEAFVTAFWTSVIMALLVSGNAVIAHADGVPLPYTFSSGTTISSDQVNKNFQALGNAIPRISNAVGAGSVTLSTTYQNLATLTITPPESGTIVLLASAGVTLMQGTTAGGQSWGTSTATLCITQTSGGGPPGNCNQVMLDMPPLHLGDPEQPYSPRIKVPLTMIGGAPVTKGTPVTFYLTAAKDEGSAGASTVSGSGLGAIFLLPGLQ
jgi:hypothetical protein